MLYCNKPEFLPTSNRAVCYGDGIFETIRVWKGQPLFWNFHLCRIKNGLATLQLEQPNRLYFDNLYQEITAKARELANENLRVRLSFVRKEGGFYLPQRNDFEQIIQFFELNSAPFPLYEKGIKLAIAPNVRLPCDVLSNCKTLNGLRYILAAQAAQQQQADEAILLNTNERIAEASNANLFIIKHQQLITPPLTEGCVAGVCRAFLLAKAADLGYESVEKPLHLADVAQAESVFLSNVISGLRPVATILNLPNTNFDIKKVANLTQNLQKMIKKG